MLPETGQGELISVSLSKGKGTITLDKANNFRLFLERRL